MKIKRNQVKSLTFFHLGFLSQAFTNHKIAREGGRDFINSSLPLPPASETFLQRPKHVSAVTFDLTLILII